MIRCRAGACLPTWGESWRQGCPQSPEWEGELELDSAEEEEGDNAGSADKDVDEGLEDYLKEVIESPSWVLVRDFLSSADVLEMRTTGLKYNVAKLYGSFAELWFFPMKEENDSPVCVTVTVKFTDSTTGCLKLGSYRT